MPLTDRELEVQGQTPQAPGTTEWTEVGDSVVDTARTLSHALVAGQSHYVTGFEAVTRGAALAQDVVVELRDGANVKWRTGLGNAAVEGERTGVMFPRAMEWTQGAAVDFNVGAGGAGVIIALSMLGYTT